MYAEKFNFKKYVQFRNEAVSIEQADNYDQSGCWVVRTRNLDTLAESSAQFDGVMICTGHHGTVNQPKLKGEEKFKGQIMHTHSLKHSDGFEGKKRRRHWHRQLGNGCCSGDISSYQAGEQ